jgi:gamma-glutamyltranspeptidase/glutathione hydrolase
MVSTSHPLASAAAMKIFERGGNAVDAAVGAGVSMTVVAPQQCNLGGVVPIMILTPGRTVPITIDGVGRAPAAATLETIVDRYGGDLPLGPPRAVVPAALGAWLTALASFGRLSLADVLGPAIELAEGHPVDASLATALSRQTENIAKWPSSASVFLPGGRPIATGGSLRQPDLAGLLRGLVSVEAANRSAGRAEAIASARDDFYRGEPARKIAEFCRGNGGLLEYEDLASYRVTTESAVPSRYRDVELFVCGPWSQGPVISMTMGILANFDLERLEHNSGSHLHLVVEALKLAFADREAYFGDPEFVRVPLGSLLEPQYAQRQAARLDLKRANGEVGPSFLGSGSSPVRSSGGIDTPLEDTTQVSVADREGYACSATPSDPSFLSPLVPGLGLIVSDRGSQFWLAGDHPSVIAPRKRPRLTPNPVMCRRNGTLITMGTPGGDVQPQAIVQFLCNLVDFRIEQQAAAEEARVRSRSFPDSFWPHRTDPAVLEVEEDISKFVRGDLRRRGHILEVQPRWSPRMGGVCAVLSSEESLSSVADPRRDSYAMGW